MFFIVSLTIQSVSKIFWLMWFIWIHDEFSFSIINIWIHSACFKMVCKLKCDYKSRKPLIWWVPFFPSFDCQRLLFLILMEKHSQSRDKLIFVWMCLWFTMEVMAHWTHEMCAPNLLNAFFWPNKSKPKHASNFLR